MLIKSFDNASYEAYSWSHYCLHGTHVAWRHKYVYKPANDMVRRLFYYILFYISMQITVTHDEWIYDILAYCKTLFLQCLCKICHTIHDIRRISGFNFTSQVCLPQDENKHFLKLLLHCFSSLHIFINRKHALKNYFDDGMLRIEFEILILQW